MILRYKSLHSKCLFFDALSSAYIFFDEVEISLTRHLAPLDNCKLEVRIKKYLRSAIFLIPGGHIVRISRDIFDHKDHASRLGSFPCLHCSR